MKILFIQNKCKVTRLCFYIYYTIKRVTIPFSAIPEVSFTIRYLLVEGEIILMMILWRNIF